MHAAKTQPRPFSTIVIFQSVPQLLFWHLLASATQFKHQEFEIKFCYKSQHALQNIQTALPPLGTLGIFLSPKRKQKAPIVLLYITAVSSVLFELYTKKYTWKTCMITLKNMPKYLAWLAACYDEENVTCLISGLISASQQHTLHVWLLRKQPSWQFIMLVSICLVAQTCESFVGEVSCFFTLPSEVGPTVLQW